MLFVIDSGGPQTVQPETGPHLPLMFCRLYARPIVGFVLTGRRMTKFLLNVPSSTKATFYLFSHLKQCSYLQICARYNTLNFIPIL